MTKLQPVQASKRIISLDIIRGIAVLGILLMNIQSFSMVNSAYTNPSVFGDLTGLNKWVWIITHLLADQKFISLFSMLFGAGIILFISSKEGREGVKLYYKRITFLLLFGLIHAYLLWHGDILVTYALCGFWVFLLRRKSVKTLLITGIILLFIPFLLYLGTGFSLENMPEESVADIMESWAPPAEKIQQEINAFQGNWVEQMKFRVPISLEMQTFLFFFLLGWKASGMMLIGMAFYKNGILSYQKSPAYYRSLALICIPLGLIFSAFGVRYNFANNWSMESSMFFGYLFNYVGATIMAIGYIGLISLFSHRKVMISLFQPAGRMAFSSYILQSLICTLLFYGHGLGLHSELNRIQQLLVVFAVWIIVISFAKLWLSYYRFGPVEWLWRTLTYGRGIDSGR